MSDSPFFLHISLLFLLYLSLFSYYSSLFKSALDHKRLLECLNSIIVPIVRNLISLYLRFSAYSSLFAQILAQHLNYYILSFPTKCFWIFKWLYSFIFLPDSKTQAGWYGWTKAEVKQSDDRPSRVSFLFPITLLEQSLESKGSLLYQGINFWPWAQGTINSANVHQLLVTLCLICLQSFYLFFMASCWTATWQAHTNMVLTNLFPPNLVLEIDLYISNSLLQTSL